ncbi:DUF4376 domain-containing protein [Fusobacterium necrophorum]|uniref:DUF4376 domain-containing protein n=1 Tax=Fusobacterium necrophorum TaxID=859 RepID=A0AAW6WF59_9FUSO|nr:DUF4376 domain-containing protein [Fusobacterium necrophorum]MDK4482041.1 DUF4376 domain-containing protein [Fusobacterium necrophorum]MDK4513058.1 DUF4376 domain-containing protein [Fusobacterium necrophorum]MDK4517220.1 DUF4376 domain-containing protein [Fusobacterium necrophorum]
MFRIYTKEKNSRELFNVNLTKEEVETVMKGNLFLDHPDIDKESCIIVEQEQPFIYPTFSDGNIREKTREELVGDGVEIDLQEGEIIQDKKLIILARPSKWHTWSGTEWTVGLQAVKNKKREELKAIREEKIAENIEVHGSLFQVREKDLENFEDVARAIRREKRQLTDKRAWVLADNTIKEFTYAELLDVLDERAERKDKIFAKFAMLSIQLEKCDTVESIENIKF